MKFITVLAFISALVGSVYSIINGHAVEPNSIPYMVHLHLNDGGHKASRCGGALVKVDRVLTAGHCLKGKEGGHATVGAYRIHDDEEASRQTIRFDEEDQFPHPSFSSAHLRNDVGIVKLPEAFELNEYVALVKLPYTLESYTFAGELGKVAGWGRITEDEENNGALRAIENPILSNEECRKHGHVKIYHGNICLSAKNGRRTCKGDSGSPLTVRHKGDIYVVGVVSRGDSECSAQSIFTRITTFLDTFIDDNLD